MDNRLNVFLIVIDALRPDHLGCYGYGRETSPEIDKIAAEGLRFDNVISQSSWTKPAVASLLTSTYPEVHGVKKIDDILSYQATFLPTILKNFGYVTACIQTNPFLSSEGCFDQGFDYYIELFDKTPGISKPRIHETVKVAYEWLDHFKNNPFFLYLHLLDTHNPYAPPEVFQQFGPEEQDLFDGEIRFVDYHIGGLREYLSLKGLQEKTVLIVTSDHGEEFGEHGHRYHAKHLHGEVLRVPLIISSPALIPSGLSIPVQVRSIDLVPTILEILGMPLSEGHQGESLVPLLTNVSSPSRTAISQIGGSDEATGGTELISITTGEYKLIWNKNNDAKELYHLVSDPKELQNIAEPEEGKCHDLQSQLKNLIYTPNEKPFQYKPKPQKLSFNEEVLLRLRNLGYID
ncbi:MAG: sulfatase [Pseudomonadota bacterium]